MGLLLNSSTSNQHCFKHSRLKWDQHMLQKMKQEPVQQNILQLKLYVTVHAHDTVYRLSTVNW
jgi:hypothetical protein